MNLSFPIEELSWVWLSVESIKKKSVEVVLKTK